ncbi:hypothetical protein Hdeb2414_s0001g00006371 [Helianthus debilis subsp. tardiflorus]
MFLKFRVTTTITSEVVVKVDYSIVASPLVSSRCAETRPPPIQKHDSGITVIGLSECRHPISPA